MNKRLIVMAYIYKNILKGTFLSRPNRFIAKVDIGGEVWDCHVKNTGRCRELLTEGCTVILEESGNPNRKTKYDLIAVYKGERLINMDSQVPNKCAMEFLPNIFDNIKYIKPECVYKNSRFDFYIETENEKIFLEVKGVTLEDEGIVRFPDAPTERGVKHLKELTECINEGYKAYVLFVIQMDDVKCFMPNDGTHPEFGKALRNAAKAGVNVLAYSCKVTESSIEIAEKVAVKL
jgi:sugar fermentation stimulation protein A